jgi:hypothetical protein
MGCRLYEIQSEQRLLRCHAPSTFSKIAVPPLPHGDPLKKLYETMACY